MTEAISICRNLCSGYAYSSFVVVDVVVVSSAGFVRHYTSFDGLWYVMITITGGGGGGGGSGGGGAKLTVGILSRRKLLMPFSVILHTMGPKPLLLYIN